jgi:hypothetical protein
MNKIILSVLLCSLPLVTSAQAAFDALKTSENELRGTSRFMSMAGAYGALGGDLSTINQNPAGIGVYRSSDVGITLSLDFSSSKADGNSATNETNFNCNNIGYVGAIRLNSDIMPNFNWGFTYNRNNSYHRHYKGTVGNIQSSVTNYVAGVTNNGNWTAKDLAFADGYNPYFDGNSPWVSVLSYDSYLINANPDGKFQGLYGNGTTGNSEFEVDESGYDDEYSIACGGNISNVLYWGLGFGIKDMYYKSNIYYGESLSNAYISDNSSDAGNIVNGSANFGYVNFLKTTGTGYNFKLGFILKPINELRFGFAFHTPTYFDLRDSYVTTADFNMVGSNFNYNGEKYTNEGYTTSTWYNIHTPWRFITSIATIINQQAILSFDYEYVGNSTMRICDDDDNEYYDATSQIKDYFQTTNIFRLGGEFRINPQFSIRAGYSYESSPVKDEVKDNHMDIVTVSTNPAYQFDNSTQYATFGFGYHYNSFYFDMAYVHKYRQSEFHAFSPVAESNEPSVYSKIKDNNNRISFTMGLRF